MKGVIYVSALLLLFMTTQGSKDCFYSPLKKIIFCKFQSTVSSLIRLLHFHPDAVNVERLVSHSLQCLSPMLKHFPKLKTLALKGIRRQ